MSKAFMSSSDKDFMRLFLKKDRIMRLSKEEVNALRQASERGDVRAQYGYGRWLYYKNPYDGAMADAERLFFATKDVLPDSMAAYAGMLRYGEARQTCPQGMDIEQSWQLLRRAAEKGSELAAIRSANYRIFGLFCKAEPEQVAKEIEERIGIPLAPCSSPLAPKNECDREWFNMLAFAYEQMHREDDAIRCYEQAISMGDVSAYANLSILYETRGNMALYEEMMEEGIEKGCTLCMIYQSDMDEDDYNALDEDEQERLHQAIDERLHRGLRMGDGTCAYFLWMQYYYGLHGYEEDTAKATAYLEQGMRLADSSCFAEMAHMAMNGELPADKQLPPPWGDGGPGELLLQAARYAPSDTKVLSELRQVDDPAFLLRHKDEMERYWMPLFETLAPKNSPLAPEKTPIDPRVIVIWPSGHMDLPKADVYKMKSYREMAQELIGAEGLDAVHYSPLLEEIAKEAELELPLVMYVDRDAQTKNLPDNAIGTQLYGTGQEVRGPIIICQEDPVHDCHSFKTMEDIVGTYTSINNHCGGLLIFEKDEDDGRYDAYV